MRRLAAASRRKTFFSLQQPSQANLMHPAVASPSSTSRKRKFDQLASADDVDLEEQQDSANVDAKRAKAAAPLLLSLPQVILQHAFSFLPTREILWSVNLTCRNFHELLNSATWLWRTIGMDLSSGTYSCQQQFGAESTGSVATYERVKYLANDSYHVLDRYNVSELHKRANALGQADDDDFDLSYDNFGALASSVHYKHKITDGAFMKLVERYGQVLGSFVMPLGLLESISQPSKAFASLSSATSLRRLVLHSETSIPIPAIFSIVKSCPSLESLDIRRGDPTPQQDRKDALLLAKNLKEFLEEARDSLKQMIASQVVPKMKLKTLRWEDHQDVLRCQNAGASLAALRLFLVLLFQSCQGSLEEVRLSLDESVASFITSSLGSCSKLRVLSISCPLQAEESIPGSLDEPLCKVLSSSSSLEELSFQEVHGISLRFLVLASVSHAQKLQSFRLVDCPNVDKGTDRLGSILHDACKISSIREASRLRKLDIDFGSIQSQYCNEILTYLLRTHAALQTLSVYGSQFELLPGKGISSSQLHSLSIARSKLLSATSVAEVLRAFPGLKEFRLGDVHALGINSIALDDTDVAQLCSHSNLESLRLHECKIELPHLWQVITSLEKLRAVAVSSVTHCNSTESLPHCSSAPHLRSLYLRAPEMTDEVVSEIAQRIPNIVDFSIESHKTTMVGFKAVLSTCAALRRFVFEMNPLAERKAKSQDLTLPLHKSLVELQLGNIGRLSLADFVSILGSLPSLLRFERLLRDDDIESGSPHSLCNFEIGMKELRQILLVPSMKGFIQQKISSYFSEGVAEDSIADDEERAVLKQRFVSMLIRYFTTDSLI